MTEKRRATDRESIPSVIPRVETVDGEPVIATKIVVEPSPVPRTITAVLMVLAALSIGYTVFQQEQRGDDVQQMMAADQRADERIETVIEDLRRQDEISTRERERLRTLVVGLVNAKTPEESAALLRQFIAAENGG